MQSIFFPISKLNTVLLLYFFILFTLFSSTVLAEEKTENKTTPEYLHYVISKYTDNIEISNNVISFQYAGVPLFCVWDANADRMRMLTPIAKVEDLDPELLITLLKANYHTVLDARYAIGGETLYSTFIHPLSSITKYEIESAIRQVANTALTFGTSFSSGELVFPGNNTESESETREDQGEYM